MKAIRVRLQGRKAPVKQRRAVMEGLRFDNMKKIYRDFTLGPVEFDIPAGYVVAVIGKNGSGKSTLFECLLGIHCYEGGIFGKYEQGGEREIMREKTAFVLERCPFPRDYTPKELADCYGGLYQGFDKAHYLSFLKKYNVPANKPLRKLSRGMVMLVQIAFAFSYESRLLILDEPTAHLDEYARKELYGLVSGYAAEEGRLVLWSSHIMEELDRMADYVLGLKRGRQMFFDTKEELTGRYRRVKGSSRQLDYLGSALVGRSDGEGYSRGLIDTAKEHLPVGVLEEAAVLGDIVEYLL